MGYRINYDQIEVKNAKQKSQKGKWISVCLIVIALICAISIKVVGLEWVQTVLLPGDPAVTAAALEGMVENLREGYSLIEAVTEFCREIVSYATIPG